jgi:hypothetical protein
VTELPASSQLGALLKKLAPSSPSTCSRVQKIWKSAATRLAERDVRRVLYFILKEFLWVLA